MLHPPSLADPYAPAGLAAVRRTLEVGQVLFRAGDAVREMHVLERGSLRLQRNLADGRLVPIGRAAAGHPVAEASLFAERYHCDCLADAPASVASYPRAAVLEALNAAPSKAMPLLRHLSAQVQELRSRVELLTLHRAEDRALAWLGLRADPRTGAWVADRTWKAVADEIGLSHEALYRALARLERDGRIARDGRRVVVAGTES